MNVKDLNLKCYSGMTIAVDAFGGDYSPIEVIKGSYEASFEFDINIILCGDEEKIELAMKSLGLFKKNNIKIINTPYKIESNEPATEILYSKKECSMAKGLRALALGEADGFISAGNSGALLVGTTMIVKRKSQVKRIAFGPIISVNNNSFLLIDCGANADCTAQMLHNFSIMANNYMKFCMDIKSPKVALLNIGTEETKGDTLRKETYSFLANDDTINFIGNIEPDKILFSDHDILVTDGFTGNILIKTIEGNIHFFTEKLRRFINDTELISLKREFGYDTYGGVPLLGAAKPVFKAHGKSRAQAFKNGIYGLLRFAKSNV